jgi:hypothetical protein
MIEDETLLTQRIGQKYHKKIANKRRSRSARGRCEDVSLVETQTYKRKKRFASSKKQDIRY